MFLSEWIQQNNLTQQAVADLLGVTRPTVSYWLAGKTRPTPASASIIKRITKGKVRPDDFQLSWEDAHGRQK